MKDQLSDFYLHNLISPRPYKWSPNSYIWDIQVRAINSWITHENLRAEELVSYQEEKNHSELWIRAKSSNSLEVIFRHKILTSYKDLIPILMTNEEEGLTRIDQVMQGTKAMH